MNQDEYLKMSYEQRMMNDAQEYSRRIQQDLYASYGMVAYKMGINLNRQCNYCKQKECGCGAEDFS